MGAFNLDDFTRLLVQDDARLIVDLLKLAVAGEGEILLNLHNLNSLDKQKCISRNGF